MLHHLLDEAVAKFPDKIAITCKGDNITYAELGIRSGQLASALLSDGLKAGDRVGIFLTKSIDSLIGMFATLKAGGVYVPIDPLAPPKRAAYILGNCGVKYLVSSSDKLENLLRESNPHLNYVYLETVNNSV